MLKQSKWMFNLQTFKDNILKTSGMKNFNKFTKLTARISCRCILSFILLSSVSHSLPKCFETRMHFLGGFDFLSDFIWDASFLALCSNKSNYGPLEVGRIIM